MCKWKTFSGQNVWEAVCVLVGSPSWQVVTVWQYNYETDFHSNLSGEAISVTKGEPRYNIQRGGIVDWEPRFTNNNDSCHCVCLTPTNPLKTWVTVHGLVRGTVGSDCNCCCDDCSRTCNGQRRRLSAGSMSQLQQPRFCCLWLNHSSLPSCFPCKSPSTFMTPFIFSWWMTSAAGRPICSDVKIWIIYCIVASSTSHVVYLVHKKRRVLPGHFPHSS